MNGNAIMAFVKWFANDLTISLPPKFGVQTLESKDFLKFSKTFFASIYIILGSHLPFSLINFGNKPTG